MAAVPTANTRAFLLVRCKCILLMIVVEDLFFFIALFSLSGFVCCSSLEKSGFGSQFWNIFLSSL